MSSVESVAPATGVDPFHIHWYVGEVVATEFRATLPQVTETELGCVVKAGAFVTTVGTETTTVNGNIADIPVPTKVEPLPPIPAGSAKPCRSKLYVPAVVGVPTISGVVVLLPVVPGVQGLPEVPGVVASRTPGPVRDWPPASTVFSIIP